MGLYWQKALCTCAKDPVLWRVSWAMQVDLRPSQGPFEEVGRSASERAWKVVPC
jgi:hypothetical protein